jgi:CDP-paratose 2-epimerase
VNAFLVIGGAGFIGCNLAARLVEEGKHVIVFDNLARAGSQENLNWLQSTYHDAIEFVYGDIRSEHTSLIPLMDKSEGVFHLAAQVAVTLSIQDPRADFATNALGTLNVLEAIRLSSRKPPLIFASTNKVYGCLDDLKLVEVGRRWVCPGLDSGIEEDRQLDFHSPYGCSKGAADQYVRDYSRVFGLQTVVLRQSCIFGRNQFGVEDQGWVAHFIISTYFGRPITIFGDGKQVRDILWVDDLVDLYLLSLNHIDKVSGEVLNIGGGPKHTLSLIELIEDLKIRLHKDFSVHFAPARLGDQRLFVCDLTKVRRLLGWAPEVDINTGIRLYLDWVKDNEERLRRILA